MKRKAACVRSRRIASPQISICDRTLNAACGAFHRGTIDVRLSSGGAGNSPRKGLAVDVGTLASASGALKVNARDKP
ncbi:hypothetical protein MRX96_052156 [Rhipicephalus microplus]